MKTFTIHSTNGDIARCLRNIESWQDYCDEYDSFDLYRLAIAIEHESIKGLSI